MRKLMGCLAATTLVLGLATITPAVAAATPKLVSPNLIRNGNAEAGTGATGNAVVPVPSWTLAEGTTQFTAVQYGGNGCPCSTDPGPVNRGVNYFAGGPDAALSVATQQHPIPGKYLADIDAGAASFTLQGFFGGWESQDDNATLRVEWLNAGGVLGSRTIGPVTPVNRANLTGLKSRKSTGLIPVGTRRMRVTLTMTRVDGSYNDGYADNLSLKITTLA